MLPAMPEADIAQYRIEKEQELARRQSEPSTYDKLEKERKENEYRERKAKEFTDDGIKRFEQKVMAENRKAIKRYNLVFGTNYNGMDDMCAGFKKDKIRNETARKNAASAKSKQSDKDRKELKKAQDKVKELTK